MGRLYNPQFGRPLTPLAALSKRTVTPVSVKFWKWPRMPLAKHLAAGPGVASIERFGKYSSSMTGHARSVLGKVGLEGIRGHSNIRLAGPVDEFSGGLTVFTNDDGLYEMLTSRLGELGLEASYTVSCNAPVSDEQIEQLLQPSTPEPAPASDANPDGLASLGLGVYRAPRPFEVRAISRVLRPYSDEPDPHQLHVTVPAELGAVELRAHALRTAGARIVSARCDVFAGMTLHGLKNTGHLTHVTPLEIDWLNERSAAADPAATAARYHWSPKRRVVQPSKKAAAA